MDGGPLAMSNERQELRTDVWGKWDVALVSDATVLAAEEALQDGRVAGIVVAEAYAWTRKDLRGLERCMALAQAIVIPDPQAFDLVLIRDLPNLKSLRLGIGAKGYSIEKMTGLESLMCGPWLPRWGAKERLEELCINGTPRRFMEMQSLPSVRELRLRGGACEGLDGVEQWEGICELRISRMSGLRSVEPVSRMPRLEDLWVEGCKRIHDWDALAVAKRLRTIVLGKVHMATIGWVRKCKSLEEIRFADVDIEDGNVEHLEVLDRVKFLDKKKYSHTCEEINARIAERGDG